VQVNSCIWAVQSTAVYGQYKLQLKRACTVQVNSCIWAV